jgi:serine protein kinase
MLARAAFPRAHLQHDHGDESDPHAYRFDGELNIANRGIMEFVEILNSE